MSDKKKYAPQARSDADQAAPIQARIAPGKQTRTQALVQRKPAQVQRDAGAQVTTDQVHEAASRGTQGSGSNLPHAGRIQAAFGHHDVSSVQAYVGGNAAEASQAMGATAFATGSKVAFGSSPDLHTAAHEAAHVVQQRSGVQLQGGVGQAGDSYERHADQVADRVVRGESAEATLDEVTAGMGQMPGTGVQRQEGDTDKKTEYPKVVTIGSEKVNVASADEEKKAKEIIDQIKNDYGIDVSSQKGVDAIKAQYTKVPDSVKDNLQTKTWEFKELVALQKALAHFAPILGDQRKTSSRKDEGQEITSVSKVDQAIDRNSSSGQLDTTTLGEFFSGSKNFSMFTAGTDSTVDFSDNDKQLEGTAIHEIAHGLLKHEVDGYATTLEYWTDKYTKSGKSGAEEPITSYGKTNASEDLSEAVMYYFVDEATLKSKCPKRHELIKKMVESWQPETKKQSGTAMGDFPTTTNDGTTAVV